MAQYANLISTITAAIRTNGVGAITGQLLQTILHGMVNSLGLNYQYAGIATPSTDPGTPDQNVFYLAATAGTYTYFGGIVLADGEIAILKYNGAWSKDSTGAASSEKVNQLGQKTDDLYGAAAEDKSALATTTGWDKPSLNIIIPKGSVITDYTENGVQSNRTIYLFTETSSSSFATLTRASLPLTLNYDIAKIQTGVSADYVFSFTAPAQDGRVPELEDKTKYDTPFALIVPPNTGNNYYLPNITDTTIVIKANTRIFFGNKLIYKTTSNVTVQRVAIVSAEETPYEEVLVLNPSNGVFTCLGSDDYSQNSGILICGLGRGISWTTLPYGTYKINGALCKPLKQAYICPRRNKKIVVTASSVTIPANTRIFYGVNQQYEVAQATTINLVSGAWDTLFVFDESDNTIKSIETGVPGNRTPTMHYLFNVNIEGVSNLPDELCSYAKTQVGVLVPPFTTKDYINITADSVTIPSSTRLICGKKYFNINSAVTLQREAGAHSEAVIFNASTSTWSIVPVSAYSFNPDEYIMFLLSYDTNKVCSLPPTFYTYNGEVLAERVSGNSSVLNLNGFAEISQRLAEQTYLSPSYNNPIATPGILTLLWFSDVHGDTTAIAEFLKVKNKYPQYILDCIHTGDSVRAYYADTNPFESVIGADYILNVIGNHEAWIEGDTDYNATEKQTYDKIFLNNIANWDVVQPDDAEENGYCYYYKDYTTQGVRLIVLDSVHWHTKDGVDQENPAQKTWFESVLADAITQGLNVICATHYTPVDGITKVNPSNGFNANVQVGDGWYDNDEMFDCVDTFINNGGKFITWIMGHTHSDYFGVVGSHSSQSAVVIERGGWLSSSLDNCHMSGEKSAVAFNIITFDIVNHFIKITRIGNDFDMYLRKKETICYNYANKQIVSCNGTSKPLID